MIRILYLTTATVISSGLRFGPHLYRYRIQCQRLQAIPVDQLLEETRCVNRFILDVECRCDLFRLVGLVESGSWCVLQTVELAPKVNIPQKCDAARPHCGTCVK